LLFLLCACQPTPEKEFIVSHTEPQAKPTENGGESVNPKVETDPSAIPARWEETMDVAGTKIVFEADVRTDEDARHPLYKVRHGRFGGETCLSMIESVFGKTERRMNQLSRDDIMAQGMTTTHGSSSRYRLRTRKSFLHRISGSFRQRLRKIHSAR